MKKTPIALAPLIMLAAVSCGRVQPESPALASSPAPRVAQRPPEPAPQKPEQRTLAALDSISDALITARLRAGLLADSALAGSDISVNTDRGVVTLTGTVKDREQAAIASAHAQREDGVMRIDNHLTVDVQ